MSLSKFLRPTEGWISGPRSGRTRRVACPGVVFLLISAGVMIYFSLGSNMGNRAGYLRAALNSLAARGIRIRRTSSLYQTEPIGLKDQPAFLNMVVQGETSLEPFALLQTTQAIENLFGRQRTIRWGPRTLDIDLLLYGRLVLHSPTLEIPHPRLTERRFVLVPLAEIAPRVVHPVRRRTIKTLLKQCKDTSRVEKYCQD